MITLTDDLFIGKGFHRKTYFNPENPNTCIKILHADNQEAYVQLKREIKHNMALQHKHKDLQGVAKYLGTTKTNLGPGYIFELIKDLDSGKVSESLEHYIKRGAFIDDNGKALYDALSTLKSNMLTYGIIPMEMYPGNILCQRSGNNKLFQLIIIDDIGTASLIPFEYYFTFAANSRIKRRWKRFMNRFSELNNHPIILKIVNELQ